MFCYRMLIPAAALCAAAFAPSCRDRQPVIASSPEIRVYPIGDSGFGYAIYQGTRKLIDQPHIPATQKNVPFRSRQEAQTTAELVSQKIQAQQFPPTVTIQELDSLQIHYQ